MTPLRTLSSCLLAGLLLCVMAGGGCGKYGKPIRRSEPETTAERTAGASASPVEDDRDEKDEAR